MKPIDILLLVIIAVVLFFAVRRMVRVRRSGGCGCGCPGCDGGANCPSRNKPRTGG